MIVVCLKCGEITGCYRDEVFFPCKMCPDNGSYCDADHGRQKHEYCEKCHGKRKMNDKLIYVAGPYAKGDCVENTNRAIKMGDQLVKEGFWVYVPHLSLLWHIVSPHPVDFWYNNDLEVLKRCDAVLRIPGESSGSDKEVAVARENGIPVFYNIDSLRDWANK